MRRCVSLATGSDRKRRNVGFAAPAGDVTNRGEGIHLPRRWHIGRGRSCIVWPLNACALPHRDHPTGRIESTGHLGLANFATTLSRILYPDINRCVDEAADPPLPPSADGLHLGSAKRARGRGDGRTASADDGRQHTRLRVQRESTRRISEFAPPRPISTGRPQERGQRDGARDAVHGSDRFDGCFGAWAFRRLGCTLRTGDAWGGARRVHTSFCSSRRRTSCTARAGGRCSAGRCAGPCRAAHGGPSNPIDIDINRRPSRTDRGANVSASDTTDIRIDAHRDATASDIHVRADTDTANADVQSPRRTCNQPQGNCERGYKTMTHDQTPVHLRRGGCVGSNDAGRSPSACWTLRDASRIGFGFGAARAARFLTVFIGAATVAGRLARTKRIASRCLSRRTSSTAPAKSRARIEALSRSCWSVVRSAAAV